MSQSKTHSVTIIGAGSIGVSFAAVMIDAGCSVDLIEPDIARRESASSSVARQIDGIGQAGLRMGLSGTLTIGSEANSDLSAADLILECGPERLDAKRDIFGSLLQSAGPQTVLATASSAIPMSQIVPAEADQARCLVAHPINPPSILRLVELVPAPGTSRKSIEKATSLFQELGFAPIPLTREIEGFVLNRLQGAVLREAYRLVDEGIASPNDIDDAMRLGLGPRWALSGPFETAELNTPGGLSAHAARMGPAYKRMGEARGETVHWTTELVDRVVAERRKVLAEADIPQKTAWRVSAVAKLVRARDKILGEADD